GEFFGGCAPGQHLADERHIDTTGSVDQIGVGQSFLTEHDAPKPVAGIECVVGRRDDRRLSDWPRRHGHGTWWYWYGIGTVEATRTGLAADTGAGAASAVCAGAATAAGG